jgi:ABC-type phosphate transport system substrate-binding protein
MKSQSMNTRPLGLKVLAIAVGTLALAACGEEQATYTAADEARTKEMSMSGCAQMGGEEAVCECVFDKMKANLSKEDFSTWVKLTVAIDGATTVQEAVEKTGMSEAELRKANAQYAGEGARAGMECEAELAQ